jgi:hypothetical protein
MKPTESVTFILGGALVFTLGGAVGGVAGFYDGKAAAQKEIRAERDAAEIKGCASSSMLAFRDAEGDIVCLPNWQYYHKLLGRHPDVETYKLTP